MGHGAAAVRYPLVRCIGAGVSISLSATLSALTTEPDADTFCYPDEQYELRNAGSGDVYRNVNTAFNETAHPRPTSKEAMSRSNARRLEADAVHAESEASRTSETKIARPATRQ